MPEYSTIAWERAMKVQEVILRAMAKELTWWQAAEIIGISDRSMRRWKLRYQEHGCDGLLDRRRGKPSPKRVPLKMAEEVLQLYREKYADLNVRHFHEKLREAHRIELGYTWVKLALQGAGLVKKGRKRGVHRKRRERRPLPGMLLHLDGSRHQWFQDQRWYDLIEVVDDATSETYYAQLVEEESTRTVMRALRAVVEGKGRFCALYSDRASHFFETPTAGGPVSRERRFGTWQGRLPQELCLAGIGTLEEANRFLRQHYIGEMNRRFSLPAAQPGNAFVPVRGQDLDRIFSLQHERAVAKDNTVRLGDRTWQIERTPWRGTLAGCRVTICEHLQGGVSIVYGPHVVGRYAAQGEPLGPARKTPGGRRRAPEESVRPEAKALVPVAAGAWWSPGGAASPWSARLFPTIAYSKSSAVAAWAWCRRPRTPSSAAS